MSRWVFVLALCLSVLTIFPSSARVPLHQMTADGTWDCKDLGGTYQGTIVVAEKSYAFVKTDGTLGGYGDLFLLTEERILPLFVVIGGYLKDEMGVSGLDMRGPRDNVHDLSGDLFLAAIISVDDDPNWDCVRRETPEA